jgi:hypothetical protein
MPHGGIARTHARTHARSQTPHLALAPCPARTPPIRSSPLPYPPRPAPAQGTGGWPRPCTWAGPVRATGAGRRRCELRAQPQTLACSMLMRGRGWPPAPRAVTGERGERGERGPQRGRASGLAMPLGLQACGKARVEAGAGRGRWSGRSSSRRGSKSTAPTVPWERGGGERGVRSAEHITHTAVPRAAGTHRMHAHASTPRIGMGFGGPHPVATSSPPPPPAPTPATAHPRPPSPVAPLLPAHPHPTPSPTPPLGSAAHGVGGPGRTPPQPRRGHGRLPRLPPRPPLTPAGTAPPGPARPAMPRPGPPPWHLGVCGRGVFYLGRTHAASIRTRCGRTVFSGTRSVPQCFRSRLDAVGGGVRPGPSCSRSDGRRRRQQRPAAAALAVPRLGAGPARPPGAGRRLGPLGLPCVDCTLVWKVRLGLRGEGRGRTRNRRHQRTVNGGVGVRIEG